MIRAATLIACIALALHLAGGVGELAQFHAQNNAEKAKW